MLALFVSIRVILKVYGALTIFRPILSCHSSVLDMLFKEFFVVSNYNLQLHICIVNCKYRLYSHNYVHMYNIL